MVLHANDVKWKSCVARTRSSFSWKSFSFRREHISLLNRIASAQLALVPKIVFWRAEGSSLAIQEASNPVFSELFWRSTLKHLVFHRVWDFPKSQDAPLTLLLTSKSAFVRPWKMLKNLCRYYYSEPWGLPGKQKRRTCFTSVLFYNLKKFSKRPLRDPGCQNALSLAREAILTFPQRPKKKRFLLKVGLQNTSKKTLENIWKLG